MPVTRRPGRRAIGALPRLTTHASRWLLGTLGVVLTVLGVLILTRPLTSLWLLAVYVGASCVVSGVAELARTLSARWWDRASGVVWVLAGLAVIVWLGRSVALLPVVLAVLLVIGGLSALARLLASGAAVTPRLSEWVLAGTWGAGQLVLGVLALTWPDLTLLTAAVLFAVRTLVFGIGLIGRGLRGPSGAHSAATRRRSTGAWPDVGRWALSVVLVVVCGGAWWASASLRSGLPVVDAFYTAPSSVPDDHGALLRAEDWPGTPPAGAQVRRILYTTTDVHDRPAVASAVVVVPDDLPDGPRPLVAWAHGTTGIARACAPSLMPDMFRIDGVPAVADAIENGWVLVATDYTGQGTEGTFPYLIGEGEARSTLDSVTAARQLDDLDLSDQVAVWGHSQGGHAALWTGATAPAYSPDLDVVGVAAISPAADPLGLARALLSDNPSPVVSLAVSWVLIPFSETYDDVEIDDYVTPTGRALVREMSQRCTTQPSALISIVDGLAVTRDRPLFTGDATVGPLADRLQENQPLGPWPMPLLLAWGGADEVIAPDLQHGYVADLCGAGSDLTWTEYPGDSHAGVVQEGSELIDPLVDWTADRFDGVAPPPARC